MRQQQVSTCPGLSRCLGNAIFRSVPVRRSHFCEGCGFSIMTFILIVLSPVSPRVNSFIVQYLPRTITDAPVTTPNSKRSVSRAPQPDSGTALGDPQETVGKIKRRRGDPEPRHAARHSRPQSCKRKASFAAQKPINGNPSPQRFALHPHLPAKTAIMASSPRVTASLPAASLFVFPPVNAPPALAPPLPGTATFAPPFQIPDTLYQAAYDVKLPITIAILYAVSVKSLNVYNKSTNKRPWAISKTKAFSVFVIAHNVFLAVYSAWTFYGMFGALWRSVARPWGPDGLAGFADSMCRIHGQSGLGNGIYYIDGKGWKTTSQNVILASDGSPRSTDAGRLWNEGMAFYGWLFYLSKFYEVLDTFIILAKGKLSSTLQTYHHAGAMMCMWAGMRFMAAPIWIFCFFNSGIHALMVSASNLGPVK
jgi:hypothetical protein